MAEKLVRDLIPYVILSKGEKLPPMRVIQTDPVEGLKFLVAKLDEEVAELKAVLAQPNFTTDIGAMEDAASEAGDIFEVLARIVGREWVLKEAREKAERRGSFTAMVILDFPEK